MRPNRSSVERPSLSQTWGARAPGRVVGMYVEYSSGVGGVPSETQIGEPS